MTTDLRAALTSLCACIRQCDDPLNQTRWVDVLRETERAEAALSASPPVPTAGVTREDFIDWFETLDVQQRIELWYDCECSTGISVIRSDQFANFTYPSEAGRAFLTTRGAAKGAADLDTIFDAMQRGGFAWGSTKNDPKGGLRIALGKDNQVRKLPNGTYGLWEWYPNAKRPKKSAAGGYGPVEAFREELCDALRMFTPEYTVVDPGIANALRWVADRLEQLHHQRRSDSDDQERQGEPDGHPSRPR